MKYHLQSKTIAGLLVILAVATGLSVMGKLTAEMVDILKWIGTAYFSVRAVANYSENKNAVK